MFTIQCVFKETHIDPYLPISDTRMIPDLILRIEHCQTRCTLQLVRIVVSGPMTVQLLPTGERLNAHIANESPLHPMGAFYVIVQLVDTLVVRSAVATVHANLLVDNANVFPHELFRLELLVADRAGNGIDGTMSE